MNKSTLFIVDVTVNCMQQGGSFGFLCGCHIWGQGQECSTWWMQEGAEATLLSLGDGGEGHGMVREMAPLLHLFWNRDKDLRT